MDYHGYLPIGLPSRSPLAGALWAPAAPNEAWHGSRSLQDPPEANRPRNDQSKTPGCSHQPIKAGCGLNGFITALRCVEHRRTSWAHRYTSSDLSSMLQRCPVFLSDRTQRHSSAHYRFHIGTIRSYEKICEMQPPSTSLICKLQHLTNLRQPGRSSCFVTSQETMLDNASDRKSVV